ncbi:hypothetical protein JR316_0009492 [Psilocybe cubensis]|uniref:Uncharacterized protein n=2 Tax=Psilocybe cubensis TaxID=181762 RepID=A0ACB8GNI8_PSICU|nr:hypothetical protein JR316_0009492 [Psilocybe cubensis]KAH9477288.1 hypothetical protein JR316_0009492 [Psilocybe cubensis]
MDVSPQDEAALQAVTFRRWSMLASLAMVLYEYVITFSEEMKHIWRYEFFTLFPDAYDEMKQFRAPLRPVRLIYIFSRYVAIIVGSVNVFLIFGPLSSTNIPRHRCRQWFTFQLSAACLIMGSLDAILMLRVDVSYSRICDINFIHPSVIYYGSSVLITHISLVALTVWKYDLIKMNIPIVRIVTRDGAWITVLVCSMFSTLVPWALIHKVQKAHILFGWPISMISIGCCRMIMNMQKLDVVSTELSNDAENLTELTSELLTIQIELKG